LIDWASLSFGHLWPLWLGCAAAVLLFALWYGHRRALFPDMTLIMKTVSFRGVMDRLPVILGGLVLLLLMAVLMEPSVVRIETVRQQARDFLVIVDTSRSMRHDTDVRRNSLTLNFRRRTGTFDTAVDDPGKLPYLARYELARESLLAFLERRHAQDRVALVYFNDDAYTMSAPTSNIRFVVQQLASMDDYVNYGTDIATAMESGLNLLERYPHQNKRTVILLTDAEARYTREVEQQLSRLASRDISFYLLWITTDEADMSDKEISSFLNYARTLGKVVTINDLSTRNLENAMLDISRQEGYMYEEVKRRRIDLSFPLLEITRLFLLVWLLLVATWFHPAATGKTFEGNSP
jgi:Mg-chelatase subunit ChlD